jgi:hypothetical protein
MKTKRRFKRRTRQLKQKKSLKQKNRTKRIGGSALERAREAAWKGVKYSGITSEIAGLHLASSAVKLGTSTSKAMGTVLNGTGTLLKTGEILVETSTETTKRASILVGKTVEETPHIAGRLINLGLNLTSDVTEVIASSLSASMKVLIRTIKLIEYFAGESQDNLFNCAKNDKVDVLERYPSYTDAHKDCFTRIINTSVSRAISIKTADLKFTIGQIPIKKAMIENLLLQLNCSKGRIFGYTKGCDIPLKKTLIKTGYIIKNLKTRLQIQLDGDIAQLKLLKGQWTLKRSFPYLKDNQFTMEQDNPKSALNEAYKCNKEITDVGLKRYVDADFYINFQNQLDAIIHFLNEEIDRRETQEQLEKKKADNEALVKKTEETIKNIAAVESAKPIETSESSENSLDELIQEQDNVTQTLTSASDEINEKMSDTIKENANTSKANTSKANTSTPNKPLASNTVSQVTNSTSQPNPESTLSTLSNPLRVNSNTKTNKN